MRNSSPSKRQKRVVDGVLFRSGDRLRHIGYAGGWKKFEPLWDWAIRAKRVGNMLPALETILSGFGKHSARRKPEPPAVMKADLLAVTSLERGWNDDPLGHGLLK